jgi:phage terminase large subunit-like protein
VLHGVRRREKILQGSVENDETFVIIYTIDDEDDWTSEIALRKANPNFGISVDADYLLSMQANAIQTPRKQAIFKTKHLNVWVGALNAYFDLQKWRDCKVDGLKMEDFHGKRCFMALDLASKIDLNALDFIFPLDDNKFATFTKYYMPEATLEMAGREHLKAWAADGWIKATDGEIIDFEVIRDDILTFSSLFQAEELGYDPWQATQLATELQKNGAKVIEYRQTVQNMSEPMKTLDAYIRSGQMQHDGNPVTTWCLGNVVAKTDAKDNVYPRKAREENKIDGAVAKIMNLGRVIMSAPATKDYKIFFV